MNSIPVFKNKKIAKELNALVLADDELPLMEVVSTVEGEGIHIGTPRIFVRVAGCAVGCKWCDTKHSWSTQGYPIRKIDEIIRQIKVVSPSLHTREISITGGEPLHYPKQISNLCSALQDLDLKVNIETSGLIIDSALFTQFNYVSMDIKTPSSGVRLTEENIEQIKYLHANTDNIHLKAVIANEYDFDWLEANFLYILQHGVWPIVLTPCCDNTKKAVNTDTLAATVSMIINRNKGYNIRTISQQHKLLSIY